MIRTYTALLDMLEPRERTRFWILTLLICIAAVLEVISIASILPFLQVLATPGIVDTSPWASWGYALSGTRTPLAFAQLLGVASIVMILLSMVLRMGMIYGITRFAMRRSYTISTRLLSGYLSQNYPWFLAKNTSELSKTVLSETEGAIANSLLPALRLIQAGVTAGLTIALLVVVEPVVAGGTMILLGGSYAAVYYTLRGRLQRSGENRLEANRARFRLVHEAMGGVKEIKFLGLEEGVSQRYANAAGEMARERTFSIVAGQVPRYLLEGIAFSGLIVAVMVLIGTSQGNVADLVPVFGLLAVAMTRLFPSLQMLYNQIATIRSNEATLGLVHDELMAHGTRDIFAVSKSRARPPALVPLHEIGLEGVSYTYPDAESSSLSDLSLTITAGTRVGIVGGTGAGKTTLVDLLLGLLQPDEGAITVDGAVIDQAKLPAWQAAIGYVPQDIALWDSSVLENIAFGHVSKTIDHARVQAASERARLHDFVIERLAQGYETVVGDRGVRLSGGQRQRIGIARSLYTEPRVLIFDEATSALDTITERAVMDAIESLAGEMTVIMVAHRLSTVQNCDCIFLLENGRLVAQGSYDELVDSNESFRSMALPA